MTAELVFYTNPMSRGRIVRWMLEEVGAAYRTEVLDYGTTMKAPAYLAINPMGKVPALVHGDQVVTEAAAICAYLADAFPDAGLAPAPAERGAYYRWLFYGAGPIEAAVLDASLGIEIGDDKRMMAGYGHLSLLVDTLEAHLDGREFIAGDRFTAADVYTGSEIGWGMQFGPIESRPALVNYYERLCARPAWRRASAADDALLPAGEG